METFINNKTGKLKSVIAFYYPNASDSTIRRLIKERQIKVNNEKVRENIDLLGSEKIEIFHDFKQNVSFETVYCDNNILVVNKPKGIESVNYEDNKLSMAKIVSNEYKDAMIVHRLDTNTDGLLVFALNQKAYDELINAFQNDEINKFYLAKVYANQNLKYSTLENYLVKGENSKVEVSKTKIKNSEYAKMEYWVEKKYEENVYLLRIKLWTGKTHQIMAQLGYNRIYILGDGKYGDGEINNLFKAKKMFLTAYKIEFNFNTKSFLYYLNNKLIEIEPKAYN